MTGRRGLGVLAWLLAAAGLGMAVWTASSWSWWSAAWVWLGRWWMVPVTVLLLAAAAVLGVLRSRHPSSPSRPKAEPGTEVMPALTPRAILLGALLLLGMGVTSAVLLLVNFSGTEPRDRLDAIRTAATLLVGTGGAAALLLTARRQRATELSLAVQHRTADATERDAAARRITELYLKAVEQLGSDKAVVRHGGLYALERVAQDNPDQRQTVINVICAYLRGPYTPPHAQPAARRTGLPAAARRSNAAARRTRLTPTALTTGREQVRQEREVRLTAQRILTTHLCLGPDKTMDQPSNPWCWAEEYDIDLTEASLIDFDAARLTVRRASFNKAQFTGTAVFSGAIFASDAWFDGATFAGGAWFDGATFTHNAWFNEATFAGGETLASGAWFNKAIFASNALFAGATFAGGARFYEATFTRAAWFHEATFTGDASFGRATFTGPAQFDRASVTGAAVMEGAVAAAAVVKFCAWPEGWMVDDYSIETAVSGRAPEMLRLVPVPAVLAKFGPSVPDPIDVERL